MAGNKTKPTDASVEDYIASRANAQQRTDCRELMVLFKKVTRHSPRMMLSRLGKHKMGKVCLYFKELADLDRSALEKLVVGSIAEVRRRHG
jgi:hypothetical protein